MSPAVSQPATPTARAAPPARAAAPDDARAIDLGRRALQVEADAVAALARRLDREFPQACRILYGCRGRVVVTGMGKSGHVGGKVAATLASTGTPAFFLHPAEASHGDLGMITRDDVVLALSNSGETAEIVTLVPTLKRLGVPLVAMTGQPASTLARAADVHLDVSVPAEACPLNLAPTASTTATLAMGDALAVTLLELRGFTAEDFARSHPGGSLGRRLLTHVADVMRPGDQVPRVTPDTKVAEGLLEMSRGGLGMTTIVDGDGRLLGVFTDGDLRRALDRRLDVHATAIGDVMTRDPRTIGPQELAAEAVLLMERHRITALLVVDEGRRVLGALNVHDLLRAGVM
jgi:arabinose-5-phosphate isomerase